MDAEDGGAAGAVALATSAEKRGGKKGLGMKISSNFETIPRRRNPDLLAKLDGSESEIAGGTPRKKSRNLAFRVDRERAERTKQRATMPITQDGIDDGPTEDDGPPMTPIKSGVTLEASVEDVWSGNEDDDKFILGGPTAGAKRSIGGGAAATAKSATPATTKARATDRAYTPIARGDTADDKLAPPMCGFTSGFTLEAFVEDAVSGDEANDEFGLGGLTAGAKCYAGGGAATTATSATLRRTEGPGVRAHRARRPSR